MPKQSKTQLLTDVLTEVASTSGIEAFGNDTDIFFVSKGKKFQVGYYVKPKRGAYPVAKKAKFDTLDEALTFAQAQKSYDDLDTEMNGGDGE